MNIIILPGNPPAEFYYKAWIDELRELMPEHTYFYLDYIEPFKTLSPEKNLQAMEMALRSQIEATTKDQKTILIAHSFGAYFLTHFLNSPNYRCILIYPFLGAPTLKGKITLDLAYYFNFLFSSGLFVKAFKYILAFFMPQVREIQESELVKGIKIARIESLILRNRITSSHPQTANNAILLFNKSDTWSPPTTTAFLSKRMQTIEANIAHDFVLDKKDRDDMTIFVKNLLLQAAKE